MTEQNARTAAEAQKKVPAAKIQFLPEDRAWIAARIQEVLSTGQLTLGKYGKEFEEKFAEPVTRTGSDPNGSARMIFEWMCTPAWRYDSFPSSRRPWKSCSGDDNVAASPLSLRARLERS